MALLFTNRLRVVSRHRLSALLSARRCIHQEFVHPHDVPAHQTPTLGEGDYEGKEIDESTWDMRRNIVNFRSDEIGLKHENEGQDFPSWIWKQDPEQFLPEEQNFWEFWGHYPFMFFGAAMLVSKEYWLSYSSFPAHGSWICIPIMATFALSFGDFRARVSHTRAQFRHDRDWMGVKMLRSSLNGLVESYENALKSKERGASYDAYLRALNQRKVAFYAHSRRKEFTQDLLRRLSIVKQAEETYEKNIKGEIVSQAISTVENKISSDVAWKAKWDQNMFSALEQLQSGDEPSVVDTTDLLFEDYLNEKAKALEKEVDNPRPMDSVTRGLSDVVLKNLTDLRVYDGTKDLPAEFVPRMTGIYGPVSPNQLEDLAPSQKHLKERKLHVVEQQLSRFRPDSQPQALLDRKAQASA